MGIADVYYQHPDVPAEYTQKTQNGAFNAMGAMAADQRQQADLKKQEDLANAPISPELQALFAQTANDMGRPDIAEKYSARTSGVQAPGENNTTGFGSPSPAASTGLTGYSGIGSENMPRVASSMPQPMQQAPQKPMNNRDFNSFMTHAQPIAQRKNARDIATEANITRRNATEQKTNLDFAKLTAQEQAQHLKSLLEEKKITKAEAYHMAQIALGRDRLQSQITKWRSSSNTKDRQKILDDMDDEIRAMESEITGISSNPLTLRMNPETAKYIDGVKEEVNSLKELRQAYRSQLMEDTSSAPNTSEGVTTKKQEGATAPTEPQFSDQQAKKSKYEVGKTYTIGGKKRKVLAIKPDGTLSTQVMP